MCYSTEQMDFCDSADNIHLSTVLIRSLRSPPENQLLFQLNMESKMLIVVIIALLSTTLVLAGKEGGEPTLAAICKKIPDNFQDVLDILQGDRKTFRMLSTVYKTAVSIAKGSLLQCPK